MTDQPEDLRRVELPTGDAESRREFGRQLAMDALLELALHAPTEPPPERASPSKSRWMWLAAIAAICVVVAVTPVLLRRLSDNQPHELAQDQRLAPPAPGSHLKTIQSVPGIDLADWRIEPTGAAVFRTVAAQRLRLDRGELHVAHVQSSEMTEPVVVETELATVTAAEDAEFLIGTHYPDPSNGDGIPMFAPLTRVLVLAGVVTLATPAETLTGTSGHLLAAERDKPPVSFAVEANNGFAFDLYGELARKQPDAGLFFSPYSLSVALAMTAEGARGETAEQMARVLRFSEAARHLGSDAQAIPFNVGLIHTGFAALNQRWNRKEGGDREVRAKIESLKKALGEANRQALELRKAGKDEASNKAALKSQDLAGQLNPLLARVDQFELRVANALWGEKTYPFRQDFIGTIDRYYGTGGIFTVDFRNQYEAIRRQINGWAAERTYQKIPELISKDVLSPEDGKRVRLILTNAIYFKGEWSHVFPENQTRDEDFSLGSQGKVRVPLMHHGDLPAGYAAFNGDGTPFATPREVPAFGEQPQVYPGDDGFALLELPYKGDELSMVVMAPRSADGLAGVEKLVTAERWPALLKSIVPRPVNTYVPRFKLDKSFEASDVLKSLGMVRAFALPGPDGAQFDGMCASDDPEHRLSIGKVLHAARIEVTEKGTEAAAATAVIMMAPPSPVPQMVPFTPVFRADRPFMFLIRDKISGTILFIGRVTNPAAK